MFDSTINESVEPVATRDVGTDAFPDEAAASNAAEWRQHAEQRERELTILAA